jgi:hypothetical protein
MTRTQRRFELAGLKNTEIQAAYDAAHGFATGMAVVIRADKPLEISRTGAIDAIIDIENGKQPFDPDPETTMSARGDLQ